MLKAHLHGFLMEWKHYNALRSVLEPTDTDVKKRNVKDKFEKLKENRIILQKVVPKFNKDYAKELIKRSAADSKKV